jgi:hypothetical protein
MDRLRPVKKPRILGFIKKEINNNSQVSNISVRKFIQVKSTFFTYTITNKYNITLDNKLGTNIIFNLDQFLNFCKTKFPELSSDYKIYLELQKLLPNLFCKSIGEKYVNKVLEKVFEINQETDYDICFLLNIDESKNPSIITDFIQGFAIVQRGECPKYPNTYCLNLLCGSSNNSGTILFGLYLYTIISHPKRDDTNLLKEKNVYPESLDEEYYGSPVSHIALLELSGGYKNLAGLCLYSKFGLKEDIKLSGRFSNCFQDKFNLPMIRHMNSLDINQIINIVLRKDSGFTKPLLCQYIDKKVQHTLSLLYTLKLIREKEYQETNDETIIKKLNNINQDIHVIEQLPLDIKFETNEDIKEINEIMMKIFTN